MHLRNSLNFAFLGLLVSVAPTSLLASESEEQAVRETSRQLIEAFNQHDAKAIGQLWTDDGDYVDETGTVTSGREAIVEEFEGYFARNKGRTLRVYVDSIRFITPEVAIVDGTSEVDPPPEGAPVIGRYTSFRVKREGKWLLAAVRESDVDVPSNYEYLRPLEWMVGEWLDADEDVSVRTSVRWGKNKNFLIREFTVKIADRPVMSGTQRVGWDPDRQQIKSWVFDSDGGVSEGYWIQDGDQWIVRSSGELRDGGDASATHVITTIDDDTFTWQSVNRVIDGEAQPDVHEVRVIRLPPNVE